jgi:hypothetical protein
MKARLLFAILVAVLSGGLSADTIEGVVRSVDPEEFRVVVVTASDEIVAARGSQTTPVRFEGSTYRIGHLEVGDRISMTVEGEGDSRRVEAIDVLESISPSPRVPPAEKPGQAPPPVDRTSTGGRTLTSVVGRVDQLHPNRNMIRIIAEGGLSWVRIDTTNAQTPDGQPLKMSELKFGETIEAIGSIGGEGQLIATIIRRESQLTVDAPPPFVVDEPEEIDELPAAGSIYLPREIRWLDVVEFEGEVLAPPTDNQILAVRNDVTGNDEELWCDVSLVALVDDDPLPASQLQPGMRVTVRALRVSEGLVAQSIRGETD